VRSGIFKGRRSEVEGQTAELNSVKVNLTNEAGSKPEFWNPDPNS
jgi:hypothetical protein